MKIKVLIVSAEGESAFLQGLARTLLTQMDSENTPTDEPLLETAVVEEEEESEVRAPRRVGNGMATNAKLLTPASPRRLGVRGPSTHNRTIEWQAARLMMARKTLNECRLCTKIITEGQAFRAPDSNPTARAHDDCVQARADAAMRGESAP